MEFATQANAAGAKVTVIMHGDQALKGFKQDYVEQIIADLTKRGVTFLRNVSLKKAEQVDNQVVVTDGADVTVAADWVLDATGRIPNVEGFGLDEVGVASVSYTHLRAHETDSYLVCRLLLEKKKKANINETIISCLL